MANEKELIVGNVEYPPLILGLTGEALGIPEFRVPRSGRKQYSIHPSGSD